MTDRLLVELLALREQLRVAARSPGVDAARRLTVEVMPVLEPVWSVLVDEGEEVGFLRKLDTDDEHALNSDVKYQVVRTYRSLDLTGPDMCTVWRALSRPSTALVDSVRNPPRPRRVVGDGPVQATLGASVRPALPGLLLGEWRDDTEMVPALRRVLRMWCEMARNSTGERREVARLTLAAAMLAHGAVLDGDTETVKWFVKGWLGLIATDSRIDGTNAALLENGWHHRAVDDEFSAVRDSVTNLRIEAHGFPRPGSATQPTPSRWPRSPVPDSIFGPAAIKGSGVSASGRIGQRSDRYHSAQLRASSADMYDRDALRPAHPVWLRHWVGHPGV